MASNEIFQQKIVDVNTGRLLRVELFNATDADDGETLSVIPVGLDQSAVSTEDMMTGLLEAASTQPADIQPYISINVANSIFFDDELLRMIMHRLEDLPYGLSIEVSQLGDLPEPRKINATFSQFRRLDCSLELDNFGSAFCKDPQIFSEYSFDSLKLDPAFVQKALSDSRRQRMLSLITNMVRAQDKWIIATGVTSQEISDKLKELGIHLQQGTHIHAPQRMTFQ
jgi:EAL domain-containing protein (putative c-di-GMP-specific phosphodiesterase class I)